MLTRLNISGFKNLMDVDIRFSPFTCIAGANGVGKSNLFDAIQFLSALSDRSSIEAARSIRDEGGRSTDVPLANNFLLQNRFRISTSTLVNFQYLAPVLYKQ
jgi:predicted ATPase